MTKGRSPLLLLCGFSQRKRCSQLFGNRLLTILWSKIQGIMRQLKIY